MVTREVTKLGKIHPINIAFGHVVLILDRISIVGRLSNLDVDFLKIELIAD